MTRKTTIELCNPAMEFSAGHFTIFSATNREPLHGHNFTVAAEIEADVDDNGMTFDYKLYKDKIIALCDSLNNYFLIAEYNPHTRIEKNEKYTVVHFHEDAIPFLEKDIIILPLANISIEELSRWFAEQLLEDTGSLKKYGVSRMTIKVFTKPGQCACFTWKA